MDSNESNKVIAFDTLFSTNHIQMLKVLLPYMDNQAQKSIAVYIKFLELNYTIDFYQKHPFPVCGCVEKEAAPDFLTICTELIPFCTKEEKKQMEQIKGIFQSMEMYREMSRTMEMMKDIMPDMGDMSNLFSAFNQSPSNESGPSNGAQSNPSEGFDMMGMLMNMLTPEQKEIFQLFGGNHHDE